MAKGQKMAGKENQHDKNQFEKRFGNKDEYRQKYKKQHLDNKDREK